MVRIVATESTRKNSLTFLPATFKSMSNEISLDGKHTYH
jgi:hypothetical protein